MSSIVNIAAYHFAPLTELESLRNDLLPRCEALELKGTILLSPEGINLFLAGSRESIDSILETIRQIPGLESLTSKESFSDTQPFGKMLIKLKREIIAFGHEEIAPGKYTSPRISAAELKQWLDEGRPVTLLDTRNDYEIEVGTFRNAIPMGLNDFRHFPQAVERLPEALKSQPVVTFCTGGIRCEKAAPWLEHVGFQNVYQLDGGILKYFEDCGGDHFDGDCFVFDDRAAVDHRLAQTPRMAVPTRLTPDSPFLPEPVSAHTPAETAGSGSSEVAP